jgi:XTP/dITP diphosphohydrolase
MSKLLIATHNNKKFTELQLLLHSTGFKLISLSELGISQEIDETGTTFEQNAELKAAGYLRLSGFPTLADDSGLEVEALNGEPGVYSARYGGTNAASDQDRTKLVLQNLAQSGSQNRMAQFKCVVALAFPEQTIELYNGVCTGEITNEPRGDNGFGYDPIFLIPRLNKTLAELTIEEKSKISHRSAAISKAASALKTKPNLLKARFEI